MLCDVFVFSVFQRRCASLVGKDFTKMIFRIEAGKAADGGYGMLAVLKVLDSHVYPDGIDEADGCLSKLLFEKMVQS